MQNRLGSEKGGFKEFIFRFDRCFSKPFLARQRPTWECDRVEADSRIQVLVCGEKRLHSRNFRVKSQSRASQKGQTAGNAGPSIGVVKFLGPFLFVANGIVPVHKTLSAQEFEATQTVPSSFSRTSPANLATTIAPSHSVATN